MEYFKVEIDENAAAFKGKKSDRLYELIELPFDGSPSFKAAAMREVDSGTIYYPSLSFIRPITKTAKDFWPLLRIK